MEKIKVAVIVGTTREQRKSIHAAKYIVDFGNTLPNVDAFLVDPKDFTFNGDGNDPEGKDPRYTKIVESSDAFFIVTPEYNHSFPGSLKRMLDSELEPYIHKPVAFAGVSSGRFAGVRAIEQLVVAVRELGLIPTFTDMHFPRIQELFDEQGTLLDESYNKYLGGVWEELIWMAQTLSFGRKNVTSKYHTS